MVAEMQRLRQQLEMAHVELICAKAGGPSSSDVQVCCRINQAKVLFKPRLYHPKAEKTSEV